MPELLVVGKTKKLRAVRKFKSNNFFGNLQLTLLALPTVLVLFIFNYLPMAGMVLAFKDYTYTLGIFRSKWIGLKNFDFFFSSQDAWRITRNTLGYAITFNIVGIIGAVILALLIYEVRSRIAVKFYQTVFILPRYLSWVIIAYISYIFLNPEQGIANNVLKQLGRDPVTWFAEAKYWPWILTVLNLWKNIGLDSIMYYAALMGVDTELYEASRIDGANRWQQTWYISLPALVPLILTLGILHLANIFKGDFGLFFQIPRDVGILYPTTDIIDTYVFRGLRSNDIGMSAAVGVFQSVVGLIAVVFSNKMVKKVSPENSLY